MKSFILNHFYIIAVAAAIKFCSSCNTHTNKNATAASTPALQRVSGIKKPASSFKDTLIIKTAAAIFYHPDSLQLLKIKAQTDSTFYEGSMHEYFYQMRNARIVIKKNWPQLLITESKNYRYLLFKKTDGAQHFVDLDSIKEPYGLMIFNSKKKPVPVDMTNIETDISFYINE